MKRFAIVLSGCGVYDGAEIHEATMSMLAIKRQGADYQLFAPDMEQHHVINHLNGETMPEKRNVLIEAARIARGQIQSLAEYHATDYDALLFPGGFGAAKNLCNFAFKGADCTVHPTVEKAIHKTHQLGKPIGALCISPVLLAKLIDQAEVTIGQDAGTATAVENMGATHRNTTHGEVTVDTKNNLFTTPCYMLDASIVDIANGAENIVKSILDTIA